MHILQKLNVASNAQLQSTCWGSVCGTHSSTGVAKFSSSQSGQASILSSPMHTDDRVYHHVCLHCLHSVVVLQPI